MISQRLNRVRKVLESYRKHLQTVETQKGHSLCHDERIYIQLSNKQKSQNVDLDSILLRWILKIESTNLILVERIFVYLSQQQ
jgi:hypothetical protein